MSEEMGETVVGAGGAGIDAPPVGAMPAREPADDPRGQLHRLAQELIRTQNRHLLMEYLRLRRAVR